MKRSEYFAHSASGRPKERWQLLSAHLQQVAEAAGRSADKFGARDWGYAAGLLHDLGKYSAEFQARLNGDLARVDHSTAGACLAVEQWKHLGRLLAFVIAGHHAGLANGSGEGERTPLKSRLDARAGLPDASAYKAEVTLPESPALPKLDVTAANLGFACQLFTRMIFSCLIDADRIDTGRYYAQLEGLTPEPGITTPLPELKTELDRYLVGLQSRAKPTEVNRLRAEILEAARTNAELPLGHFSLTVPTGGGKTLASLAFALEHAIAHKLDRVIYVIPYTNIIEQTAEVFREALGPHAECVLEHHSAFDDEKLLAGAVKRGEIERGVQGRDKLRRAAENWSAPIIVTTAVQFFESLFSNRPTQCRKLHNIARSVVILDEAQTLPLHLLRPSVAALDELKRNYHTSVVLCTATQPGIVETGDPDRSFKGGLPAVREIAPEPRRLYSALKRVTVESLGVIDDDALTQRLAGHAQALCIVPTRRHARELYLALKNEPGTMHLSALMCPQHRSERLAGIRERLKSEAPCRLIATSLIEAGVDVDFPTVYRATAGIDSIAQAAGRCNREGRRAVEDSKVYVFEPAGRKPPPSMAVTTDAGREVMRKYEADPLALEAIDDYFQHVYWRLTSGQFDDIDRRGILSSIAVRTSELWFPFEDIARDFQMIDNTMRPILVPYGKDGPGLIEALEGADEVGRIARKLQRYVVQVPRSAFAALAVAGSIQPVNPDRFGDQFWRLENTGLYDEEFGLDWSDPTFREAENLVL